MRDYNLAIVGSTGAVGEEILRVLEEFNLPLKNIVPMASARTAGKKILYKNKVLINQELTPSAFKDNNINIAIFSAGGSISKEYAQYAVDAGAVVIDNTSYFRMDKDVPLVVPEVNLDAIRLYRQKGIIANPNCSTIQLVHILKPLDDIFNIKRVDVSTYQAVSGAGKKAINELLEQTKDIFKISKNTHKDESSIFPHQIALNCIPQVDTFELNAYTKEEMKMVNETQKILGKEIQVSATCVRVPVVRGHSEAVSVKFKEEVDLDKVFFALEEHEHISIYDDIQHLEYPTPLMSEHKNETFVGRIRKDIYNPKILHFWVVADNLRVGAATNSVRIAKEFINMGLGD